MNTDRDKALMRRVLFVCRNNTGRSHMSRAVFERESAGRHSARSASTGASSHFKVPSSVYRAMEELDFDVTAWKPRQLTPSDVHNADVVVGIDCCEQLAHMPGVQFQDWKIEDPSGLAVDDVRAIRAEIERRVRLLLEQLDG